MLFSLKVADLGSHLQHAMSAGMKWVQIVALPSSKYLYACIEKFSIYYRKPLELLKFYKTIFTSQIFENTSQKILVIQMDLQMWPHH